MSQPRGTTNRNVRGSTRDRAVRRRFLVDTFGNGIYVLCKHRGCTTLMTVDTVTVDRIIPGCQGGTYRRDNIQPMCGPHNSSNGATIRRNP